MAKWKSASANWIIPKIAQVNKQFRTLSTNNPILNGHHKARKGGNRTRFARTYDVTTYVECCKTVKPNIYSVEIQNKLLHDKVRLPENVPSVSRCLTNGLAVPTKAALFLANHKHQKWKRLVHAVSNFCCKYRCKDNLFLGVFGRKSHWQQALWTCCCKEVTSGSPTIR